MSRCQPPVPKALAKHGITHIEDNVPDGYRVQVPVSAIIFWLGDDLREALARRYPSQQAPQRRMLRRPPKDCK